MKRWITNRYVTACEDEVERLCGIDHTPPEKVDYTDGVEPVHVTGSWAYWSDGRFTTGVHLSQELPKGGSLSPDAVRLISSVWGADGSWVEGGLQTLTTIKKIVKQREICDELGLRYATLPLIRRVVVERNDGTTDTLYTLQEGYGDGYQYDVYMSREKLEEYIERHNLRKADEEGPK